MIQTISILGCGWLGLPLAKHLFKLGYVVKGSTTTAAKIPILNESNIDAYLLTCAQSIEGKNVAEFFKCDALFVNIPFRRDFEDPLKFVDSLKPVVEAARNAGVKKVIFASSTSIYPLLNQNAIESDFVEEGNARARALFQAEQLFLKTSQFETTVIRFAGMYGPGREIGSFLKKAVSSAGQVLPADQSSQGDYAAPRNQNAPVNLIHLEDCIGVVTTVIQSDTKGEIFNACGDAHPLRKDLYVHAACAVNPSSLKILRETSHHPPVFADGQDTFYKIVVNEKIKSLLNYRFIYPSPWLWIDHEVKR